MEQGLPYFIKFKKLFPSIQDLAQATTDEVMKAWQGLGYYSRARNLHFTAQYIYNELDGIFPDTYEDVIKLKGVGPYTAAAICSFAYGLPYAVVDGNVYRVLSRFFGIDTAIDSTNGKKEFASLAQALIDPLRPGDYNQAVMDFGATQCVPANPNCMDCPLQEECVAFKNKVVDQLPKKEKKIKKQKRFFQFLVVEKAGKVLFEKRGANDIWKGLYQFPLIETKREYDEPTFFSDDADAQWTNVAEAKPIMRLKQTLTHQQINACFWLVKLHEKAPPMKCYDEIIIQNIHKFAVPKIIDLFLLKTKGIFVKK